ncbi:MAG: ABC transporter ATP-binding protein [Lentisphaeria bacterium]|nr:ABC transporter ATP-binding protein [Lentisphaeria bacterium]
MSITIQIDQISYSYKDHQALNGVSIEIPAGSIVGVLGPNGSGKSTLFKLITTSLNMQKGTAKYGEYIVGKDSAEIRKKIGVVFQSPALDGHLSVKENLLYHGQFYGLTRVQLKTRVDELLQDFNLADRSNDTVKTLSGGLKRRVELCRAILHNPEVLILDEPSTGLDPNARLDFWDTLEKLQIKTGLTILFSTHWFEEAEMASHLAILSHGKLIAYEEPSKLREQLGGYTLELHTEHTQTLIKELTKSDNLNITPKEKFVQVSGIKTKQDGMAILNNLNDQLDGFSLSPASLKDVYLNLTGEEFVMEDN